MSFQYKGTTTLLPALLKCDGEKKGLFVPLYIFVDRIVFVLK